LLVLAFVIPFALIIGSDDDWGDEDWEADVLEGGLSEDVDSRKVEAKLLSTLGRESVRNFVFVSHTMSRKGTGVQTSEFAEWVASPYPPGTFTTQDTSSFSRRDNVCM
jgi:hypothetical protein